jgi:hypothetical protein
MATEDVQIGLFGFYWPTKPFIYGRWQRTRALSNDDPTTREAEPEKLYGPSQLA